MSLGTEAAGRLVEQQQPGLGDQRPGERHPLLHGVGQLGRQPVGDVGDVEFGQPVLGRSRAAALVAVAACGSAEQGAGEPGPPGRCRADHHVLAAP